MHIFNTIINLVLREYLNPRGVRVAPRYIKRRFLSRGRGRQKRK